MPFIIITGIPCSGKSKRAEELRLGLKKDNETEVHIVSENEVIKSSGVHKNIIYSNSQKEKEIRGILKSEALRLLGSGSTVILDAGNYIKGYRYELYCATKGIQTTQVTVECCINENEAWSWNETRSEEDCYSKEIFDALVMRYETPNSQNRWDFPLVTLLPTDVCPVEKISTLLYERKPPPPNMSTQSLPASSTTFVYDLDKVTKDLISSVFAARKLGFEGDGVKLSGFSDITLDHFQSHQTPAQLARMRRQFLQYTKLNPPPANSSSDKIAQLFVQFINSNI
ncbi:protein KTI12 homolog [Lycorma delicatula]|uniref:protein KTI12 homolog n=1 Tax=Lycorma delicatula TaxID=130591 RepID=UPI003F516B55